MKQEDKELLLKDLCARLPYNFVYLYTNAPFAKNKPIILTPVVISNLMNAAEDLILKPYLRPLSSMTEEEEKELGNYVAAIKFASQNNDPLFQLTREAFLGDFFNKHHIDYRGLIEMGLAIKAPEGMYEA